MVLAGGGVVRHVSWCVICAVRLNGDGKENQMVGIVCLLSQQARWMQDEMLCTSVWQKRHTLAFSVMVSFITFSCSACFSKSFWRCFKSFFFSLLRSFLLFFCWVSTLWGFTHRNQFCLASLPLEGNIGIYKYSHAAISDPQLRDWTSGWAVLVFDHEACIHASLDDFSFSLCFLLLLNFFLL